MEEQTGEYGAWMNGYPKHVVSTTLQEPLEWNNSSLIEGDVAEEVGRLKQQPGKDILITGGSEMPASLTALGLIDEYHVAVHPIVLGGGKPLFGKQDRINLRLVDTRLVDSKVVILHYEPIREGSAS